MLLALWPLFIAMPETANYALLDQQKRDARRLAERKSRILSELERLKNGATTQIKSSLLDIGSDASRNIDGAGSGENNILGLGANSLPDGRGLSEGIPFLTEQDIFKRVESDKAMKLRNDEAFILILANL